MNFLAHCALAHDAAEQWACDDEQRLGLLAGAVIGDFVKGRIPEDWPTTLQAGARLHRKIDALSNVNSDIRDNCDRFPSHLRRFAPIFVDMLADHCLSLDWAHYYHVDKPAFSQECYAAIETYRAFLPQHGEQFLGYMQDVDLLASYDHWPHIARGLKSVLRRLDRLEWFVDVESASLAAIPGSQEDFARYYPALRGAWQQWHAFNVAPQS